MTDIAAWAQGPYGFYVDRHYDAGAGRWRLTPGPIRLAPYHAAILRHCFTPDDAGRLPYDVVAWCEAAKSGKSAIAGLVAKWIALHGDKNSVVVMASNKQNQAASLMYKSLTDSIAYNPHLPNVAPGRYSVDFANGNTVAAIPSNSRGEAGARFSLALFDELWGYVHTDATRLWAEFKTDPTRLNSLKMAIGYAGYTGESDLWHEQLTRGLAGEPVPELAHIDDGRGAPACWRNGRHFTFWSHVPRQPWQTDEWVESQRKNLRPAEFARMILCDFSEGQGDFVSQEAWEALVNPYHSPLPAGDRRYPVYIGLDVATKPFGDDCALVGVYQDGPLVKIAFHKIWKGGRSRLTPLRLSQDVKPYITQLARDYDLAGVWFDPYQALQLAEELRAGGVRCFEVSQTHASRGPKDTELYEMVSTGELVLYDHPELRQAAVSASAKELGNGLLFIKKAGRGKIDLLIALSNCAKEARYRPDQGKRVQAFSYLGSNRATRRAAEYQIMNDWSLSTSEKFLRLQNLKER